jgi:hypothetical protein
VQEEDEQYTEERCEPQMLLILLTLPILTESITTLPPSLPPSLALSPSSLHRLANENKHEMEAAASIINAAQTKTANKKATMEASEAIIAVCLVTALAWLMCEVRWSLTFYRSPRRLEMAPKWL